MSGKEENRSESVIWWRYEKRRKEKWCVRKGGYRQGRDWDG